jgi:spermidine synthase
LPETTSAGVRRSQFATWPLLLLVFISGMTTMAVEMAASRLLGPYFGDSILVWANLIGLILIYLTVGAYLGGRWADRSPQLDTLYRITAAAALLVGLVPLIAAPILHVAQNAFARVGIELATFDAIQIGGSFIAALVLFAPSVTLLGCVSPFAIRLVTKRVHSAGRNAGRVYAISTVGSILGTFLPVLLTIPAIGTARTFLLFAALLLAASLLGLITRRQTAHALLGTGLLLALTLVAATTPQQVVKADARAIAERESRYNYIQVIEIGGVRYLMLNEGQGVHSIYDPNNLATTGTWDVMAIAPFFNDAPYTSAEVRRVCVIGLAAGTVARQATAAYGPIPIDGVEIDPAIVQVGQQYFAMDLPNLNVYTTDGRFFLEHTDHLYDLIVIDAYRLPYIPFQLSTSEFFRLVRSRLTEKGVVAVNVGRTESDYRMVEAIAATMGEHFASVHAVDLPETFNTVLVATPGETEGSSLQANLAQVTVPFARTAIASAAANLHPLNGDGRVFTDDRAPVERLTNSIILRYLLVGE